MRKNKSICGDVLEKAITYAMAVLEVNASMGLIVVRVSSITCQDLSLILYLMKKYVCLSQGLVTAAIFIRSAAAIPQQTMAMSFLLVKISLTAMFS